MTLLVIVPSSIRSWQPRHVNRSWMKRHRSLYTTNISSSLPIKVCLFFNSHRREAIDEKTFSSSAYELWFKQMLFEINSVRDIFIGRENLLKIYEDLKIKDDDENDKEFIVDERKMLEIVTRINRCVKIMKERSSSLF